jgi:hypothetical protein
MRKAIPFVLIATLAGGLFAQAPRPAGNTAEKELLAEVRALRAEIHQAASAGIRAQLLVARLQLQEQRVVSATRQLLDTQSALTTLQARTAGERSRLRQLEDASTRATSQGRATFQQAILDSGTQIEQQLRQELELQAREKELLRSVHDAQARWADFNSRLDELVGSLP